MTLPAAVATNPPVRPKPRRVRVWKDGARIVLGTKPGLSNWYDTPLTREQVADLVRDLVQALA
jgi:hypothetical protein